MAKDVSRVTHWVRAVIAASLLGACTEEPTTPSAGRLFIVPGEATIDLGESVQFSVRDSADKPVRSSEVTATSSDQSVVQWPCNPPLQEWTVCAARSGTATITFNHADGRVGTATVTVRAPRFILQNPDTPFVATHGAVVRVSFTDPKSPTVKYRSSDSLVARLFGGEQGGGLSFLKAGSFDLEVINVQDTTIRTRYAFAVEAQRATRLLGGQIPSSTSGLNQLTLAVRVLDQRDGLMNQPLPAAEVLGADPPARIVRVGASSSLTETADVFVEPIRGGTATVRVSLNGLTLDLPITLRAVAPDSAFLTKAGTVVNVAANDGPLSEAPRIVTAPTRGTASVTANGIRYDPAAGFLGVDSLRYAGPSGGRTDTTWVRFTVMPGPFSATLIGRADSIDARDLNDAGQVAGTLTLSDGGTRAFRWTGGRLDTLYSGGRSTRGVAISNNGNVLGLAVDSPGRVRAMLWPANQSTPIDLLGRTAPEACCGDIDKSRGVYMSRDGVILIALDAGLQFRIRGTRVDTLRETRVLVGVGGVNDRGSVLLNISTGGVPPFPAELIFADGSSRFLQLPGRGFAEGSSLNNLDMVVGSSDAGGAVGFHPFLFDGSAVIDLTTTYGSAVRTANWLNDAGWIVGAVATPSGSQPALLYQRMAGPLASLLSDSSLTIRSASRINGNNQILAVVVGPDAVPRTAVLTLVP